MNTCVSYASFGSKNGHVIFRVKDDRGPLIIIHSTCNVNQRTKSEFYVNKEVLEDLSKCFAEAAKYSYESRPHHNQAESPSSLMQGDIDEYGDPIPQGSMGFGDGTVTGAWTLLDRGYKLTATLIIDDGNYPPMSIVPGTAKGIVRRLGKEIQKFTVSEDGKMNLEKIGNPIIYIVDGFVNQKCCYAEVAWNDLPGENYLTFDFDCTTRE